MFEPFQKVIDILKKLANWRNFKCMASIAYSYLFNLLIYLFEKNAGIENLRNVEITSVTPTSGDELSVVKSF